MSLLATVGTLLRASGVALRCGYPIGPTARAGVAVERAVVAGEALGLSRQDAIEVVAEWMVWGATTSGDRVSWARIGEAMRRRSLGEDWLPAADWPRITITEEPAA